MKKPFSRFEKILLRVLAALLIIIAALSVWRLVLRDKLSGAHTAAELPSADGAADEDTPIKTYNGMGRLRCALKSNTAGSAPTLIIAPVFLYNSSDRAFTEELALRLRDFRRITTEYIAALDAGSPEIFDDAALKAALLERYNALLRLGKISTLYFTDFMLIE